jgi:hypothetical protein
MTSPIPNIPNDVLDLVAAHTKSFADAVREEVIGNDWSYPERGVNPLDQHAIDNMKVLNRRNAEQRTKLQELERRYGL